MVYVEQRQQCTLSLQQGLKCPSTIKKTIQFFLCYLSRLKSRIYTVFFMLYVPSFFHYYWQYYLHANDFQRDDNNIAHKCMLLKGLWLQSNRDKRTNGISQHRSFVLALCFKIGRKGVTA